jgi:antirestriction protein ArdC
MARPSSHSDHFATITSSILATLESGTRPWAKPWETRGGAQVLDFSLPFNGASGRQYRGINVPWLFSEAYSKGYASQAWLTFKQAQELGGSVMRGEKATHVFFAKQIAVKERANDGTETTKPVYLLRAFPVFNAAQCSGVQLPTRQRPEPATPTEA